MTTRLLRVSSQTTWQIALAATALTLAGCAEISFQHYTGTAKPDSEVAILRLWTPTTTNVFTSPGLIVEKIDGVDAGSAPGGCR